MFLNKWLPATHTKS